MSTERMIELKRLVKIMATVDAFPGKRGEVLARMRVDQAVFDRDSQGFGAAFASLGTHERAELTELHRLQRAAMQRDGVTIESLGTLPVDDLFATRSTPKGDLRQAITEPMGPVRVVNPATPFAGQTTPERLAVIRAAHPLDEETASEYGDTVLAPSPKVRRPIPWQKTEAPANDDDGAAGPDDETRHARRVTREQP